MKRYLITSALLASTAFAATNAQITSYMKDSMPPQYKDKVKITVLERTKVKSSAIKGLESVLVKMSDGSKDQTAYILTKGDFIFPDVINIKEKTSLVQDLEKNKQAKLLKVAYKKEKKENIISIGNDPKKETLVVFTDPECPYCRKELGNIEERLKEKNIKLIMTPVHGKSSLEKSYLIYKNVKNAKSDKDKLAIVRKYYDKNVDISKEKVTDAQVKQIEDLRQRYLGEAIKGVPFIISENKLK